MINPKSKILNSNPTGIALPIPIKEGAKQIQIFQIQMSKLTSLKHLSFGF